MSKRMIIMLISLAVLFGCIFGFQLFKGMMIKKYLATLGSPTVTVSAQAAEYQDWLPILKATGSLRAVQGVNVTTEVPGLVSAIHFTPGSDVKAGDVLINLNAQTDIAQLEALQATAALAKATYERTRAQYAVQTVSKSALDTDTASLKNQEALVNQQAAFVAKKTIRAPFSGQIGISAVNPGQYLNPGDKIAALQSLNPIYVDFYVPQQNVVALKKGQSVTIILNALPKQTFQGKNTALDPIADSATRNVQVEATIDNPQYQLIPGMFADVNINTSDVPERYLTLPQTAVTYNPYGESVYLVQSGEKDDSGTAQLTVTERFIKTGKTRGDQVAIIDGIKEGEQIVTAGQLKLKKGSRVAINNEIQPNDNPAPHTVDE